MKRYFFLVSLVMVVFLGLGSVTNGQNNNGTASYQGTQGQGRGSSVGIWSEGGSTTTNTTPTTTSCEPACDTGTQKCVDGKCVCDSTLTCCGIKLNTSVPFIGNCIESKEQNPNSNVTDETAFPVLMGSLTKILVTVILIISFVLIIVGGIMIATGDPSGGKKMIMKVVIGIALLGASGVILRLINPNFFG